MIAKLITLTVTTGLLARALKLWIEREEARRAAPARRRSKPAASADGSGSTDRSTRGPVRRKPRTAKPSGAAGAAGAANAATGAA